VYHLTCYFNENICKIISELFYKFKIYRFITLSTYSFTYPVIFLIIFKNSRKIFNKVDDQNLLKKIFLLLTFSIIISNFLKSFQTIYLSAVQSFQVRNEEYYDRFIFKNGGDSYYGWIKTFSKFIINNTPEDSSILLPPQSVIYKMEGNIYYFRWFLYPRRLFHIENGYISETIKIKYVVISAGECNNSDCVWPDYTINKDDINKIIVIDRKNQKTQVIENKDYQPKDFQNMWGIVELK